MHSTDKRLYILKNVAFGKRGTISELSRDGIPGSVHVIRNKIFKTLRRVQYLLS